MNRNRITRVLGTSGFIATAGIWLGTQLIDGGAYKMSALSRISVLAVPTIMLWAAGRKGTVAKEKPLLLSSLALATLGDALLSMQGTIPGIAAFLGSQLLNTVIFTRRIGAHKNRVTSPRARLYRVIIGLTATGIFMVSMIPRVHGAATGIAVSAYIVMITAMAVQAMSAYFAAPIGATKKLWARSAAGGVSQLISDMMLGYSMFVGPFPGHDFLIMGTYWLAIWLYAASLEPNK